MGCLYPDRIFLGVGTGESLNEIATGYEGEWPEFKERYARLRESVRLMRELWLGDRVDFEGEYYHTKGASIYDVPEGGIPIYIAAGGPQVAKYAGRAGDGFICTSGKGEELYKDKLIPAMKEGAEAAGKNPDDIDRMIEIKISYDTDPDLALENTRFWAPLSLTAEQKTSIHDPIEMERRPTRCRSNRSPSAGSSRRTLTRRSRRSVSTSVGASTTWCSTRRATTSAGSWSFSKRIWRPDCGDLADTSAIYIAAPEPETGKSTIALGLLNRLTATVAKVGVFRPITRLGGERDYILELLLTRTTAGLSYEQCVGVTYQQLHADIDAAITGIVESYHAMAQACDAVVIVGSDYTDVASPAELSVNARIAVNLGAPVLLVVGANDRTAEQVASVVEICLTELATQRAQPRRWSPTDATRRKWVPLPRRCTFTPRGYVLPDEPLLRAPTVAELQQAVHGTLVSGDTALVEREAMSVLVAGMTADHVLERLRDGMAVITPGDRSDVVLAVASAHAAEGFPSLCCLILNGGFSLHPSISTLVSGLRLRLPIVATAWGPTKQPARPPRLAAGSPRSRSARSIPPSSW